ncbi:MAG: fumarylacetoacetate hydrolase family protein [Pseudomonadota bacterium]
MKLATLNDGTRDGQLAVVSRDLKTAELADGIAATLQRALDDWTFIAPQLEQLSRQLNDGKGRRSFDFVPANCMAPLPRACQRAAASPYVHHEELAHKARKLALPTAFWDEPLMRQGSGDAFIGAHDDIELFHEEWGIDFEAGLAAFIDDVPAGATPDQAYQQIRLLALVNDVALRNLAEHETENSPIHSRPACAFSPVAVTPDELGDAWKGGKVHLPLRSTLNGKLVGQPQAGADMIFNFPQLIAHLVKSRPARAGTIVGAGPLANKDAKRGYSCIQQKRWLETIADGAATTPWLAFGDSLRIEMLDGAGKSVFGAIEQGVKRAEPRKLR